MVVAVFGEGYGLGWKKEKREKERMPWGREREGSQVGEGEGRKKVGGIKLGLGLA